MKRRYEAAMLLRFQRGELHVLGWDAQVEPGRKLLHRKPVAAAEHELAHDLLHPGGAGLGIGGDDDVVVAEAEIVPHRGIEVMVVQLARLLRERESVHDQPSKDCER